MIIETIIISAKKIFSSKIVIELIAVILLFILSLLGQFNSFNRFSENTLTKLTGRRSLDSSIIIIHINAADIEKLGGWPLKRSYYALLIGKLTNLGVSKIGIEVLLSNNSATQSMYNDLLNEEIKRSGRVVVSSLITNADAGSGKPDSIIYSQPKSEIPDLATGHLNYISDDGIYIPNSLQSNGKSEKSFSLALANKDLDNKLIKINFYNSWKNYQNYSLLEFFRMVEENDSNLVNFKNKIILVGVSDPSIAKTISTGYDNELPGIALHAFALDNILTNRSLNFRLSPYLAFVFLLLLIVIIPGKIRLQPSYAALIYFFGFFAISYILLALFFIEINYSAIIIPTVVYLMIEFGFNLSESKAKYLDSFNESEIMRRALSTKEEELTGLKNKLGTISKERHSEYTAKIVVLEDEISRLKKWKDDNEPEIIHTGKEAITFFEGMVFRSDVMQNLVEMLKKFSASDATTLILGESGSGKELVAHAIHNLGKRKDKNFIAVNCAALSESLLESELFGHVKGAFTNAITDRKGKFELADGGTIFLDEIGETTENFQAKLLRVIQFGEVQKVGAAEIKHVNVRLIAATNKNLEERVKEKLFREDLYYRINVLKLELPPLRERKDDIELLAHHFIRLEDSELKISKAVLDSLTKNEWKGNVRELESVIKRAVIFAKSESRKIIQLNDLSDEYRKVDRSDLEDLILESLRHKSFSHSSINETAKELGNINRTVVSENLRGVFFKTYVTNSFQFVRTISELAQTDDEESLGRLKAKAETYIENLQKDLVKLKVKEFEDIKSAFASKYKNLPAKFHSYLDETIKDLLKNLHV